MTFRICLLVAALSASSSHVVRAAEPLFGREVVPVLYKLGCSAGACHGSFSGKGGFRLSLFASDPEADYREVRGFYGRRLNLQNPLGPVPAVRAMRMVLRLSLDRAAPLHCNWHRTTRANTAHT